MSLEFFLTSLVVVLLPGTGVLYTLAVGLSRGFRASIAAALGCTLGILPAAVASLVGLAALLHTSALAFQVLKYLGVAYLLYMAWSLLRDEGAFTLATDRKPDNFVRLALNGAMLNVLNPKLSLFFLAFLPQFVATDSPTVTEELAGLALVFMLMTLIIFIVYGAFAAAARDYVIHRPQVMRWLKRGFAGAFAFLGARLATQD
ncbi:MAG: LysE family translocator [Pseudomonadota bacterium]